MDGARVSVTPNLNTEHPVELPEVRNLYVLAHACLKGVHKARVGGSDHAIVDMYGYNSEFFSVLTSLEEDCLVHSTLFEAEGLENGGEFLIPSPAGLLKTV
jgi:hypothetical protein